MRKVRLAFARRFVEPVLEGSKRATIRYDFGRPLEEGDALHMVTPDGEHFASARAIRVVEMTAFDAAAAEIDGHRSYDDVFELLEHLGEFYDRRLTPNSDVTVIGWGEHAHEPGEYRWCRVCRSPELKDRVGRSA